MRLLVSVSNTEDALSALAGGADIIDAKNPQAGALGAVSVEMLCEIHHAVAGSRLVTAALGDVTDEASIERAAQTFTAAGAGLVKVGFAGTRSGRRVTTLIAAAIRGAGMGSDGRRAPLYGMPMHDGQSGVIAVAYADADRAASLPPTALADAAARAGAAGVLLDTADKTGLGLRGLIPPEALAAWVREAHDAGLLVTLAGRLTADDLPFVRDTGADIAGVRGAACDGGRTGQVAVDKVRLLRALCGPPVYAT